MAVQDAAQAEDTASSAQGLPQAEDATSSPECAPQVALTEDNVVRGRQAPIVPAGVVTI